jgi:hypothetical protein
MVELVWSGAVDIGCAGIAGFSVAFDDQPATLPDTAIDVTAAGDPHHVSSGPLTDGDSIWVHLRSCDDNGNCSAAVHLGPFAIDTTSPAGPFDLESTSHVPGTASEIHAIEMVWAQATDSGSGPAGFAWAVTGASEWICNQSSTLGPETGSLTTPELPDGSWYIHLCPVDAVGNWGDVVTAGPYLIAPLFADDFESGTASAWSAMVLEP